MVASSFVDLFLVSNMASETSVVIEDLGKLLPSDDTCKLKRAKESIRVNVIEVDESESLDDIYDLAFVPTASNNASSRLASSLRGQTIEVPDLHPDYVGWAQGINPHYKEMVPMVDSKLKRYASLIRACHILYYSPYILRNCSLLSDHVKLSKLQKADIALFAAMWWPRAAWNEYQVVTYLSLWLFAWDDEIDMAVGDLSHNFQAAQKFRDETALFIGYALGFGEGETPPPTRGAIVSDFKVVADALRGVYTRGTCKLGFTQLPFEIVPDPVYNFTEILTTDQLQDFLHEMQLFLEMAGQEQRYRLTDTIPTPAQYWTCRMGTSAVGICTALNEYS